MPVVAPHRTISVRGGSSVTGRSRSSRDASNRTQMQLGARQLRPQQGGQEQGAATLRKCIEDGVLIRALAPKIPRRQSSYIYIYIYTCTHTHILRIS
jgi:hypothetical protein